MDVQEIRPGLWRWTARHPEWAPGEDWEPDVACVCYVAPSAVVLIDPLVPGAEEERFWRALDRDVERAGRPVAVLLTVHWRSRSADEVAARYEASRQPPEGVEAIEVERADERVYWLPEHRALVVGDVLLAAGEGRLRVCPVSWVTREDRYPEEFLASLCSLLELPVEMVLVSHGKPVLADGRRALAEALAAAGRAA